MRVCDRYVHVDWKYRRLFGEVVFAGMFACGPHGRGINLLARQWIVRDLFVGRGW